MTQHDKIKQLCSDGEFHCQNEFRALFIFSPHKRRSEIETESLKTDKPIIFIKRKCEHGIRGQYDYRMVEKIQSPILQELHAMLKPKVKQLRII
ncbi:MAG: hypothetical protein PHS54_06340 [Clostridia bacterium]|nr:hypothetical protein [Clostridia bacterium]